MNIPARWNYLACFLSVFAAVICAMAHDLPFLLINFFFAVWNWYVAEYKRGLENETNKDGEPTDRDGDGADQGEE